MAVLTSNDLEWIKLANGTYQVRFKPHVQEHFFDRIWSFRSSHKKAAEESSLQEEVDTLDNASPNIDKDLSKELSEDAQKKKSLEEYLTRRKCETYETVLQQAITEKLVPPLNRLLKTLEGPYLDELLDDEAFKKAYEDYQRMLSQKKGAEYQQVCEFARLLYAQLLKSKSKYESEADIKGKTFNSAYRAMDAMTILFKFDVPKYAQGINKIVTINEGSHYRKVGKKSWWRKLWDAIKKFFGVKVRKELAREEEKIGSFEKAAAKVASKKIAEIYTKNAHQLIDQVEADIKAQAQINAGERLEIVPRIAEDAPQTQAFGALDFMANLATHGAKALGKGALKQVGKVIPLYSLSDLIEYVTDTDPETLQTSLAEHIEKTFSYEAKKQAFESMMNFVVEMYAIYETTERMRENHQQLDVSLAKIGFGRLEEPEFKDFMLKLSRSLGFDINALKAAHPEWKDMDDARLAVHILYYADDKIKEEAFKRYLEGDDAKGVGLKFVSDAFIKEHNMLKARSVEQKMRSDNYFYLVDLNRQISEDLHIKTIQKNAIREALVQGGIEEKFYNPDASGIGTEMTSQVKEQFVKALPESMRFYLKSAIEKKELAGNLEKAFTQGILDKFSEMLNDHYQQYWKKDKSIEPPSQSAISAAANTAYSYFQWIMGGKSGETPALSVPEVQAKKAAENAEQAGSIPAMALASIESASLPATEIDLPAIAIRKESKPPETTVLTREKAWQDAQVRCDKAGIPVAVKNGLVDYAREKTEKVWRNVAQKTLISINDLGGKEFIQRIMEDLVKQRITSVESQANPKIVEDLDKKMAILAKMIRPDGLDIENIEHLPFEDFKTLFDAIYQGVNGRYAHKDFTDLDQQADLYMMMMALNKLNSIYITPEFALRIYENVLQTEFSEINTAEPTAIMQMLIKKVVTVGDKMFVDSMSGPIKQFEYFAKERRQGKHLLYGEHKEQAKALKPVDDGYGAWMKGYILWGANKAYDVAANVGYYAGWAATPAVEASLISLDAMGRTVYEKVAEKPIESAKDFNEEIIRQTQEYIRGTTYDATIDLAYDLYLLIETNTRFMKNHPDVKVNPFEKFGFVNAEQLKKFVEQLALDLGYKNFNELLSAKYQENVGELSLYQQNKRKFCALPASREEKFLDPFVALKDTIRKENENVTHLIGQGKMANATNYLVMLSSLNAMIDSVERVQRETLAVELFAPNLDEKIGFDNTQKGFWQNLKAAARDRGKELATEGARQGVAMQLQASIDQTKGFVHGMLNETIVRQSEYLHALYADVVPIEEELEQKIQSVKSVHEFWKVLAEYPPHQFNDVVLKTLVTILIKQNKPELLSEVLRLNELSYMHVSDQESRISYINARKTRLKEVALSEAIQRNNFLAFRELLEHDYHVELEDVVIQNVVAMQKTKAPNVSKFALPILLNMDLELNPNVISLIKSFTGEKTSISPTTRYLYQKFVADKDGPKIDEVREIYVFTEQAYQKLKNQVYFDVCNPIESLDDPDEQTIAKWRKTCQETRDNMEWYVKNLAALKTQWLGRDFGNIVNYDRLYTDKARWEEEISLIIERELAEMKADLARAEAHLNTYESELEIQRSVLPPKVSATTPHKDLIDKRQAAEHVVTTRDASHSESAEAKESRKPKKSDF